MFALAKRGAGAKRKLRTRPSGLTVFLGKRRCSTAEAEPTVELAQLCHPEAAARRQFSAEGSRAAPIYKRGAVPV